MTGMDAKVAGVNIILLIGLAAAFSYGQRTEIMANWALRRCDPGVVASAYLYKPDSDTRTVAEFTKDNFQFCQGKLAKDVIETVSYPVKVIQEKQKDIVGGIMSGIGALGELGNKLANFFNQIMESVKRRFAATYVRIQETFTHLLNIMGKIMASITAMAMALIGVLVSLTTLIQFALYILAVIIGILIALMVIFAAFLAPVSWLVFAGIAVVGILAGVIAGVITQSAFCIAGNTAVILADGSTKPISEVKLGDKLADRSYVTATMKFLVPTILRTGVPFLNYEPLVSIHGVTMSSTHMLEASAGKPIAAKDHPEAVPAPAEKILYNLNTTSRRIPVKSKAGVLTLLDYEEIAEDDDDGIEAWKKHVFEFLNPGMPLQNENPENIEAGIDGLLTVNLKDGDWKSLGAVVCGDMIECFGGFTTVCGVVEIVVEDGATLYNGMTAGVWAHNGVQWGSVEKIPWITATPVKSGQKLYNLFTESGNFVLDGYLVRDFSEVGLADLSKTYSLVQKNFSKE
jgi:hypothetical protein